MLCDKRFEMRMHLIRSFNLTETAEMLEQDRAERKQELAEARAVIDGMRTRLHVDKAPPCPKPPEGSDVPNCPTCPWRAECEDFFKRQEPTL